MYQDRNKKILNLLIKLTQEKKILWKINQKKRFFSAIFDSQWIIRIIEDEIPPRMFKYKIAIEGSQFDYEIEDKNHVIEDLFQFILNNSEIYDKKNTMQEFMEQNF